MRRTRSRHVGRSVVSGATTPNRNALVAPVADESLILPVPSRSARTFSRFLHQLRTSPAGFDTEDPRKSLPGPVSIRAVPDVEVLSGAPSAGERKKNTPLTRPVTRPHPWPGTRAARISVVAGLVAGAWWNSVGASASQHVVSSQRAAASSGRCADVWVFPDRRNRDDRTCRDRRAPSRSARCDGGETSAQIDHVGLARRRSCRPLTGLFTGGHAPRRAGRKPARRSSDRRAVVVRRWGQS